MAVTADGKFLVCDGVPACEERIPNHRWGRTKAEGWRELKDGKIFCPTHVPDWMRTWSEKKKEKD